MPIAAYLLLPWFAAAGGAATIGQSDGVGLVKIYLPGTITVSEIVAMASAATAGDHWGFGLYDLDGNLVLDSGPIEMLTSGADELLTASITPTLIEQGTYWLAATTDSAMSTIVGASTSATTNAVMCGGTSVYGTAANDSSGGQLPATTGTITLAAAPALDQLAPFVKLQAA